MANIKFTEVVNAPIDQVFARMTDIENCADFIEGIESVEIISEQKTGVGTRWKETRVMFGKSTTEEMEITELNHNQNYVVEAESCGAAFRTEFVFKSVSNDKTEVTMDMNTKPLTFFAKLMSPISFMMKGMIVNAIKKDLADSARACESSSSACESSGS